MAKCAKTHFLYQLGAWKRAVLEDNEEETVAQSLCDVLMDEDRVAEFKPLFLLDKRFSCLVKQTIENRPNPDPTPSPEHKLVYDTLAERFSALARSCYVCGSDCRSTPCTLANPLMGDTAKILACQRCQYSVLAHIDVEVDGRVKLRSSHSEETRTLFEPYFAPPCTLEPAARKYCLFFSQKKPVTEVVQKFDCNTILSDYTARVREARIEEQRRRERAYKLYVYLIDLDARARGWNPAWHTGFTMMDLNELKEACACDGAHWLLQRLLAYAHKYVIPAHDDSFLYQNELSTVHKARILQAVDCYLRDLQCIKDVDPRAEWAVEHMTRVTGEWSAWRRGVYG